MGECHIGKIAEGWDTSCRKYVFGNWLKKLECQSSKYKGNTVGW